MSESRDIAAMIRAAELTPDPWPHATIDEFLPADVFAELVASLPEMAWMPLTGNRKARDVPKAVADLLRNELVLDAIRGRFGFSGGRVQLEVAWTAGKGIKAHVDRIDKLWSGQIYLAGDPKGTELFDAAGKLARVVEWRPNRLAAWTRPPRAETHAAPRSDGRFVLLYWIMQTRG